MAIGYRQLRQFAWQSEDYLVVDYPGQQQPGGSFVEVEPLAATARRTMAITALVVTCRDFVAVFTLILPPAHHMRAANRDLRQHALHLSTGGSFADPRGTQTEDLRQCQFLPFVAQWFSLR